MNIIVDYLVDGRHPGVHKVVGEFLKHIDQPYQQLLGEMVQAIAENPDVLQGLRDIFVLPSSACRPAIKSRPEAMEHVPPEHFAMLREVALASTRDRHVHERYVREGKGAQLRDVEYALFGGGVDFIDPSDRTPALLYMCAMTDLAMLPERLAGLRSGRVSYEWLQSLSLLSEEQMTRLEPWVVQVIEDAGPVPDGVVAPEAMTPKIREALVRSRGVAKDARGVALQHDAKDEWHAHFVPGDEDGIVPFWHNASTSALPPTLPGTPASSASSSSVRPEPAQDAKKGPQAPSAGVRTAPSVRSGLAFATPEAWMNHYAPLGTPPRLMETLVADLGAEEAIKVDPDLYEWRQFQIDAGYPAAQVDQAIPDLIRRLGSRELERRNLARQRP